MGDLLNCGTMTFTTRTPAMKGRLLLLGALVLAWSSARADEMVLPLLPVSLWQSAGRGVEATGTLVVPADDPDAVLFHYAFGGTPSQYGYAEYVYQGDTPLPSLPTHVKADLKGDALGVLMCIRFVDADGTHFQFPLSKVDFADWQTVARNLTPGRGGYIAFGPKVKAVCGTDSTIKAFPVVAPVKMNSLIIQRRFLGDDEHRAIAVRNLILDY